MKPDSEVEIREVGSSEAETIAAIMRESFGGQAARMGLNPADFPHFNEFIDEDTVRKALENGNVPFLLFVDDTPVGTIWRRLDREEPGVGQMRKLAILPAYRGRGYGERLMGLMEEQLKALGATRSRLMYNATFTKLNAYYERMGYRQTKQEQFENLPFEVGIMEKPL